MFSFDGDFKASLSLNGGQQPKGQGWKRPSGFTTPETQRAHSYNKKKTECSVTRSDSCASDLLEMVSQPEWELKADENEFFGSLAPSSFFL